MSVEVKLELGHRASMRDKPTAEGFTHDWTVFVRGCEGSNICHFVDKVVFHLHDSFPKPKRVSKEPPYQVSESGYAGFIMPIEVYFRSKEEPKKVRFEYDLFLRLEGSPVYNIRLEKLTFQNPSDDFRRKLLKARTERASSGGGGGVSLPTLAVAPIQHSEEQRPPTHTKLASVAEKRPKSHAAVKEPTKPPPAPVPKPSHPFENIFGTPIKAKHSPEPNAKSKEPGYSNHQKPNKHLQPPAPPVNIPCKEPKQSLKETEVKEVKESKVKAPKVEKETKTTVKRSSTPDGQNHHSSEKKRKHVPANNSEKPPELHKPKESKEKKEKTKSKSSSSSSLSSKKSKHKNSSGHHKDTSNHKLSSPETVSNQNATELNNLKTNFKSEDSNSNSALNMPPVSPDVKYPPISQIVRDIDNDFISPLSSDENHSPHPVKEKVQTANHDGESNHAFPEKLAAQQLAMKADIKPKSISKSKSPTKNHRGKQNSAVKENHHTTSPVHDRSPRQVSKLDSPYHQELVELQKRIMSLNDHRQLQRVVDVIEKTGKFHLTNSSFDFDLCSLDTSTVRQLKSCLSM